MDPSDYDAWKEVARADRAFYRCFERLDIAAMEALWLRDDRVRCIHPGGEVLLGYEQVMASWRAILGGNASLRFELVDPSIEVVGDLAWASHVERISSGDEEPEHASVSEAAATNVYQLRDGEWKMVVHHASPIARRFFS